MILELYSHNNNNNNNNNNKYIYGEREGEEGREKIERVSCSLSFGFLSVNMPSSQNAFVCQGENGLKVEDVYLQAETLQKFLAYLHICILC
jgi:hypothetical protein